MLSPFIDSSVDNVLLQTSTSRFFGSFYTNLIGLYTRPSSSSSLFSIIIHYSLLAHKQTTGNDNTSKCTEHSCNTKLALTATLEAPGQHKHLPRLVLPPGE